MPRKPATKPKPRKPRKTSRKKSSPKRLQLSSAGVIPTHVPKRWIKFLVGLFLLPPAWVLTQTFFTAFATTTINDSFWITEEFWFFTLGVVCWLIVFFGLPRPVRVYVFGHELTHAIWVWLMGGKVHRFEINREGGYILADRTNTWIALAPYFFPIYSVLAIGIYGVCAFFWEVTATPWPEVLYGVVGVTWAFHMSFTCWMIPKGQPDLHYGGSFFSLTLIYLLNLCLLAVLLIVASPQISWMGFGRDLLQNAIDFTADLTLAFNHALRRWGS